MLKDNLIIVPCNVPWDWTVDYINQTSEILSGNNTVLCLFWLNTVSLKEYIFAEKKPPIFLQQMHKNLYGYYFFHFIPFKRYKYIYQLNLLINVLIVELILRILKFSLHVHTDIIWFFDPCVNEILHIMQIVKKKYFLVYDCVDYFRGDPHLSKKHKNALIHEETKLLKESDVVVVNSYILKKLFSKINAHITVVPQGFRQDQFDKPSKSIYSLPKEKPIIGYVGAMNYRLDFSLMYKVAKTRKDLQFVFVGPKQEEELFFKHKKVLAMRERLFLLPNVLWIPGVPKCEVKTILSQFDVAMIPYDISQAFNRYCFPMKLFEYLYMSKYVISTNIVELKRFSDYVYIQDNAGDWISLLPKLVKKAVTKKDAQDMRAISIENNWRNKISAISKLIKNKTQD